MCRSADSVWGGWRRGRFACVFLGLIIFLFVVFESPKKFAEKTLLFLSRVFRLFLALLARLRRGILLPRLLVRIRHRRGWQRFRAKAKYFLEEVAGIARLLVASLSRFGPGDERSGVIVRAGSGRDAVRYLIQVQHHDAVRRREGLYVTIGGKRDRSLHELGPNGCS